MKTKIIASVLIDLLLIQILMTNAGCMAFYPTKGDNNLHNYKNYDDRILIKLKDNTEIDAYPRNLFFIDKNSEFICGEGKEYDYKINKTSDFLGILSTDKIDSSKVMKSNSNNYHFYWTKDGRRFSFENGNVMTITPDSVKSFWMVKDNSNGQFKKIYDSDIDEIQLRKANLTGTWTIVGIYLAIGLAIVIAAVASGEPMLGTN